MTYKEQIQHIQDALDDYSRLGWKYCMGACKLRIDRLLLLLDIPDTDPIHNYLSQIIREETIK